MNSWIHLLKKEVRLGVPAFLVPIIAFFVLAGIAFYFGNKDGFGFGFEAIIGVAVLAIGMQIWYLSYYLFFSLQAEKNKLHLWLHTPMSASSLVLAKIVAGLISLFATLLLTGGTGLTALFLSSNPAFDFTFSNILEISFWGGIHIVLLGLSFAIWFLFFWMIFLMLTRVLRTFVSLLSTFVLFITVVSLYGWFANTALYEKLTMWGKFELNSMLTGFNFIASPEEAEAFTETGHINLFVGTYVFEAIVTIIIFVAACWILNRKVEV